MEDVNPLPSATAPRRGRAGREPGTGGPRGVPPPSGRKRRWCRRAGSPGPTRPSRIWMNLKAFIRQLESLGIETREPVPTRYRSHLLSHRRTASPPEGISRSPSFPGAREPAPSQGGARITTGGIRKKTAPPLRSGSPGKPTGSWTTAGSSSGGPQAGRLLPRTRSSSEGG